MSNIKDTAGAIMIQHKAIDQGFLWAVTPKALIIYLWLRRRVWRKAEGFFGKRFYARGELASKYKWESLAEMLNLKRRMFLYYIQELKDKGWIDVKKTRGRPVAIVGKWTLFENRYVEIYLVDPVLNENPLEINQLGLNQDVLRSAPGLHTKMCNRSAQLDVQPECTSYHRQDSSIDKIKSSRTKRSTNKSKKITRVPGAWRSSEEHKITTKLKRPPKELNAHSLALWFKEQYRKSFKLVPAVGAREMKHLKELIALWGEETSKILSLTIQKWGAIKKKFRIARNAPSIAVIYTYRDDLGVEWAGTARKKDVAGDSWG